MLSSYSNGSKARQQPRSPTPGECPLSKITCDIFLFFRSPPRPSPGGLHYSDEDICNKYNGAVLTESVNLKEKSVDGSESEVSATLDPKRLPPDLLCEPSDSSTCLISQSRVGRAELTVEGPL